MINKSSLIMLRDHLDGSDIARLKQSAEKATEIERKYRQKMEVEYQKVEKAIEESIIKWGKIRPDCVNFESIIVENAIDSAKQGFDLAEKQEPKKDRKKRLAKKVTGKAKAPVKGNFPRSLSGLMEMYDNWKRGKKKLPRQQELADSLKKKYLDKTQDVWKKYSKQWREGNSGDRRAIIEKVKKAGRTTQARARTIVETETTKYYNEARKDYYDASDAVTHYLFVAIRDHATTKWCKSRNGVVYEKDDKYIKKETPPIHWNCRSELLPLTPANPRHKKLIDDRSRQRKNRRPAPLPPGWTG